MILKEVIITLQNNELSNKINAIYFQIPQQNLTSVSQLDANVVRRMIVVGSLGALEEYAELKVAGKGIEIVMNQPIAAATFAYKENVERYVCNAV